MARIRITTDLSVFCLIYQNYIKCVCANKQISILNHIYQSFNAVSHKKSVHNNALVMVEKKNWDNKGAFAAVLTDPSKSFDCIPHGLLIAKLDTFGFDKKLMSFIAAYLYKKTQKTKVG